MTDWLAKAQLRFSENSRTPAANADKGNLTAATAAPTRPKSQLSIPSAGSSPISAQLERRIRAMAARWQYSDEDLADVLRRASGDPDGWRRAVALDERREAEFRERGLLPRAQA